MHYKHNYLSKVIFQANFSIDALKRSIHPSIVDLCKELTGVEKVEQPIITLVLSMDKPGGSSERLPSYVFDGVRFQVRIQHGELVISDKQYTHHEEFHGVIIKILSQLNLVYAKPSFSRVALRYANNIKFEEGDTFDFNEKINPTLLGSTLDFKDFDLSRSIGIMNMHCDDIYVNFTYGFLNPEFPNKITKREFVLDFDCFKTPNVNIPDIQETLLELRAKVNILFEKSVLPELKQKMEPINIPDGQ